MLIFSVLSAECWVLGEERKLAVGCWQAFTVNLKLPTAFTFFPQHSALGTFHCLLLTADCPLPTADCLLLTLTLQTFTSMMSFQLVVGFGERFAWFGFQLLVFSEEDAGRFGRSAG